MEFLVQRKFAEIANLVKKVSQNEAHARNFQSFLHAQLLPSLQSGGTSHESHLLSDLLTEAIKLVWCMGIEPKTIQHLAVSMPLRRQAVMDAKGKMTKY